MLAHLRLDGKLTMHRRPRHVRCEVELQARPPFPCRSRDSPETAELHAQLLHAGKCRLEQKFDDATLLGSQLSRRERGHGVTIASPLTPAAAPPRFAAPRRATSSQVG